jgi:hypothetical protein
MTVLLTAEDDEDMQHLVTGGPHQHHGTPSPCPLGTAGPPA